MRVKIAHVNQDRGIRPGRRKGAAVHLAAMRRAFRALGAEVVELDAPDGAELAAALVAAHLAAPFDLVYERDSLGAGAAQRFARARGIPHVLEVNAPLEEEAGRYRDGAGLGSASSRRALFEGADLVLAVSSAVADYARAMGCPPDRVTVEPNAVDPERFAPRAARCPLRARLVPGERFAVGFHGRLRPWHNPSLLVSAAAELLAAGVDVQLVFVGEGDFGAHVRGRVAPERCTHVPWVAHEEVGAHVACFDALPLTHSPGAPFYFSPLKLLEAMAAGVVPVVPRLGDLPECIEAGRSGLVYAPGDRSELVRHLAVLARDRGLRAELGANARERATCNTWRDVAARVLARVGIGATG